MRRHFSKKALVPGVIMIEAMAQVLGWLVIYSHDFRISAVMSLTAFRLSRGGDQSAVPVLP